MARTGMGLAAVALVMLVGCKKEVPTGSSLRSFDVAEEAPAAAADGAAAPKPDAIKVALPQIAYTYSYGFELPADAIAPVQQRHVAACDRLGPARCLVLNMETRTHDGAATGGTLKLVVDARLARSFGASLAKVVSEKGGKASNSSIEAEDLSKQIVDTEAKLRSKQALAERLMVLLKTRNGPVKDLVEAERHVAEVQEEIDAAQSWLAEARGRVSMSTFELSYEADGAAASSFWEPLRSSFANMGNFFGQSLAILVMAIAALLPWALLVGGIFAAVRYLRRRFRKEED